MTRYEVDLTDEQARALDSEWPPASHGHLADQACQALADAIRANPPKPPRMAEPGWGERVVARIPNALPRVYVRFSQNRDERWSDGHNCWRWTDLIDPEPYTGDPQ